MYNLKLKSKQNRKSIALPFDEIESNDEWVTEKGYNDEDVQPQVKVMVAMLRWVGR